MYQAFLRVNGKLYLGVGQTRKEAVHHATVLVGDAHGGGFALVIRKFQRTEVAVK